MGYLELILLGIGLSMDAFAVTISNSMTYKGMDRLKAMSMPLIFGFFQGLMPLIGFYAGGIFGDFISKYSGIVILIILGAIGAKMVVDGIRNKDEECEPKVLSGKILLFQAIATSIDAFAVGIGLKAVGASILQGSVIIAVTTFICTFIALFIGKSFGCLLKNKAEILGGVILIIIGIKGMF